MVKRISILGATGSVGTQTLDIIRSDQASYSLGSITAWRNSTELAVRALDFRPELAAIADKNAYPALRDALFGSGIRVVAGTEGLMDAAEKPAQFLMAAISGMAGLRPLLTAIETGKTIGFASKECLVAAGGLLLDCAKVAGARMIPVDSEHSALFQLLGGTDGNSLERLVLTASGGPFRNRERHELASVTPDQACTHPVWDMGRKISVDSATLMNKALELIEAAFLFGVPEEKIDVVIHPQSVLHGLIEHRDGQLVGLFSEPDMRTPLRYAMEWPTRPKVGAGRLDLATIARLDFVAVDDRRFPAIQLARSCLRSGQEACIVFNAANEVAVHAFLEERLAFLDIEMLIQALLDPYLAGRGELARVRNLDDVFRLDQEVRAKAADWITESA